MTEDSCTSANHEGASASEDFITFDDVLGYFVSLGCIFGFSVNFFTLSSFRIIRRPVPPVVFIIMSLALADMGAAVIVTLTSFYNEFPTYLCFKKSYSDAEKHFELVNTVLYHSWSIIPMVHVTILEIYRWVLMVHPLKYRKIFTKWSVLATITVVWISGISLIFGYFGTRSGTGVFSRGWNNRTYKFNRDMTWRVVMAGFTLLSFIIIVGIHIHLHCRKPTSRQLAQSKEQLMNYNAWSLKVLTLVVIGTFIFGWMPSNLMYVIVCPKCFVAPLEVPALIKYHRIKLPLAAFNSLFHHIVYAWNVPRLQVAMNNMGGNYDHDMRGSRIEIRASSKSARKKTVCSSTRRPLKIPSTATSGATAV